ncbi:class I SAM-dependent methyltransferase, partial [Pseudomonas gessardii]|nr:class I SAM-dependent methyltransferase [Pseudomonas gessardii]
MNPLNNFTLDAELQNSPMLKLAEHFHSLATGAAQVPSRSLTSHIRDTIVDSAVITYHDLLVANAGPLFSHFLASVPYILEEMARIGVALTRLSHARRTTSEQRFSFFEIDAFDGSNGRALAAHSQGLIQTLTCSPNRANQIAFDRFANPEHSLFFPHSFFKVTSSLFNSTPYQRFVEGFDYLYETAAFQFYTQDRDLQLQHIKPLL